MSLFKRDPKAALHQLIEKRLCLVSPLDCNPSFLHLLSKAVWRCEDILSEELFQNVEVLISQCSLGGSAALLVVVSHPCGMVRIERLFYENVAWVEKYRGAKGPPTRAPTGACVYL